MFEFVIALVLISTLGKVLTRPRHPRQVGGELRQSAPGELDRVREMLDELSVRLERLEEERDFYRDLLEAPTGPRRIEPPEVGDDETGAGGP